MVFYGPHLMITLPCNFILLDAVTMTRKSLFFVIIRDPRHCDVLKARHKYHSNDKVTKTNERSRYISTELGIRERLVSAIITNEDTVHSMAVSVNKTLSHHLQKLLFFFGTQERAISRFRVGHFGGKIAFFEFLPQTHCSHFFTP